MKREDGKLLTIQNRQGNNCRFSVKLYSLNGEVKNLPILISGHELNFPTLKLGQKLVIELLPENLQNSIEYNAADQYCLKI